MMAERQAGTGQLRKLFYTKYASDKYGVVWRLSTWKVFFILIALAVALTIIYAFLFADDARVFLGDLLFYSIVLIIAVAILWLMTRTALKFRKILVGFIIVFVLLLTFYWAFGTVLGYFEILEFQMEGYTLYTLLVILSFMGASRLDNNLDKRDVFFSLMCVIVMIGCNLPIISGRGFLYNMDNLVNTILSYIPWSL